MKELLESCREKIREIESKQRWLQIHGFQEECRVLQIKIGGMFQIYGMLETYKDGTRKDS